MRRDYAVVTGASSGLGVSLATELARRGYDLVMVARREKPMQELADRLRDTFGTSSVIEALDLAQIGSAAELHARLGKQGISPKVLVNNAGFGLNHPFLDEDPARLQSMLQLDIVALTELTQIFGRDMREQGSGHILLVGSLASYQPAPLMAAYAAAKAYVLSLGEALNVELAPKVGVTVLSPGLMETEFNDVSGYQTPASLRATILSTDRVAEIGLDALFAGKPTVIAGRMNKAIVFSSRLLPRHVSAKGTYRMAQKSLNT
ncbi:SDR family NAD(P)-dependent oxidoreductase [Sphingobium subterraneum]|uniref:Short-chain dehydrogenase/reductase SDR n=1 Tax=Sphingobium subterraneum TaxID=627688 RepID=A0A841J3M6_9SPHN|nr:SDR family NAD(P)-dependent oxidoreductase [Sphingobium subterraneum]MBB6125300.1 hypothetical protein [Sphingobium subterraneum]